MADNGQETEAKFYLLHLDRIVTRLQDLGARLIQPRQLETNLRFDLPDGTLRSKGSVLRLRRDAEARLTYKGAGQNNQGVLGREEIEFVVGDFEKARQFLEALGYRQTLIYEKYRATYQFEATSIMLDELPYGNFVEIEGESFEQIQAVAEKLRLDLGDAIDRSYTGLFETLRDTLPLSFQDITFQNFESIRVTAGDLHVHPADE